MDFVVLWSRNMHLYHITVVVQRNTRLSAVVIPLSAGPGVPHDAEVARARRVEMAEAVEDTVATVPFVYLGNHTVIVHRNVAEPARIVVLFFNFEVDFLVGSSIRVQGADVVAQPAKLLRAAH